MNLFRAKPPAESRAPAIKRMRDLEVLTAKLIRAGFAGQYHAAFQGRGIEFSRVREYEVGDDIRSIDWNVTARTGAPHVKEFVEERDLGIVIALDVSRSMRFGSVDRRKADLAVELLAILTYAALQNGDRVGLALFTDRVERFIPPRRGRLHAQTIIRHAMAAGRDASGGTDLEPVASTLLRTMKRRGVVIFLSDFLGEVPGRLFRRLAARHDVIAMRVSDPRETRLPRRGLVQLRDAETGLMSLVDLRWNSSMRDIARFRHEVDEALRSSEADLVDLSTAVPYEKALLRFFERRVMRRRR
jgi:uncharacterized protein (DUF58 family)